MQARVFFPLMFIAQDPQIPCVCVVKWYRSLAIELDQGIQQCVTTIYFAIILKLLCSYLVGVCVSGGLSTFSTRASECEGGVNLILDLNESVQHHRPTMIEVYLVFLHVRFGWLLRVLGGREGGR